MKKRDFIKLVGIGVAGSSLPQSSKASNLPQLPYRQQFNMCGYAAPKIDTVRIGYIGLGNRGSGALDRIVFLENVQVKALCDIRPEKAEAARKKFEGTSHSPVVYAGKADEWKKLCERDDIDLIYICTPWNLHAPMALYAMEHGKHVAVEIPAATTVEDCWKLVETSERTRKHCMMLENCCYDFFELLTLNMARQGFFGEVVHVEGAYIHDIYASFFDKTKRYDSWRLRENIRKGNLYPTHGLGPICQVLDINRGDKMDYLVSYGRACESIASFTYLRTSVAVIPLATHSATASRRCAWAMARTRSRHRPGAFSEIVTPTPRRVWTNCINSRSR